MTEAQSASARLAELLQDTPPDSVSSLPDDVLVRLAEQIDAGHRQHLRVAEDATEKALKGVPLPVRGIVRKALT